MQALSKSLVDLYEAAACTAIADYPREMLKIVRQLIDFDGAVLGTGRAQRMHPPSLLIEQAHVINREIAILDDYARLSSEDPVTHMFVRGLKIPLALDCMAYYKRKRVSSMLHFVQQHEINHLLLFGNQPDTRGDTEWLALYRGSGKPFAQTEKAYLMALWPHLMRSISVNCANYLSSHLIQESDFGAALINRAGNIEVATACFRQMLLVEWPDWRAWDRSRLPDNLIQACLADMKYEGACVNFVMLRQGDYVVCTARRRSKLLVLTPRESLVLLQFSSGLSHKQIAQILGSSQNTVRSHIAHGYGKLGVHNKAALANLFRPAHNIL